MFKQITITSNYRDEISIKIEEVRVNIFIFNSLHSPKSAKYCLQLLQLVQLKFLHVRKFSEKEIKLESKFSEELLDLLGDIHELNQKEISKKTLNFYHIEYHLCEIISLGYVYIYRTSKVIEIFIL